MNKHSTYFKVGPYLKFSLCSFAGERRTGAGGARKGVGSGHTGPRAAAQAGGLRRHCTGRRQRSATTGTHLVTSLHFTLPYTFQFNLPH